MWGVGAAGVCVCLWNDFVLLPSTPVDTLSHNSGCFPFITHTHTHTHTHTYNTLNEASREVHLITQLTSIFYYTMTPNSNIHNEYHPLQFSVWYSYLLFVLEHIPQKKEKKEEKKQKRNQIPTLEKETVQLSETLQHRETRCNGQRGNSYDQCSLQLHIAKMDKTKNKLINSSDNV